MKKKQNSNNALIELENKKTIIRHLRDEAISGYHRVKGDFEKLEKGYLAVIDNDKKMQLKKRFKSAVEHKIIFAKVRRIASEIMKTYYANGNLADIEVVNEPKITEILQDEFDTLANQKLNMYQKIYDNIVQMLVYGTSCVKVYWSKEDNEVKISPKRINEVLFDPNAKNHFDCKYFIDRFFMSVGDLKTAYPNSGVDFNTITDNADTTMQTTADRQSNDLGDYKRVRVYEVYRKIKDSWYLSTLIGDTFLRVDEKLEDGHPFCFGIALPQFVGINETNAIMSYGASYIEPMIPIQRQLIVTRNQQMDAINKQLNPKFFVTRDSGLRDDDLLDYSALKIQVANIQAIKEVPTPSINQSIFDTNKLDEELQEVGGLPKLNQGITSANDPRSATGMSLIADSGNAMLNGIITSYNESFFEPFVKRVITLIYKHKDSIKFAGIERNMDFMLQVTINAGVGVMSRDIKLNNIGASKQALLTMIKMFFDNGNTQKANEYVKVLERLTKDELKTMGQKNVDDMFSDEDIEMAIPQNPAIEDDMGQQMQPNLMQGVM